jgi:hypothetical protein
MNIQDKRLVVEYCKLAVRHKSAQILYTIIVWSPRTDQDAASEILTQALQILKHPQSTHGYLVERIEKERDKTISLVLNNLETIFDVKL